MCKDSVKLSILLVSYNHNEYIDECLDGILMQKFSCKYEIIVADDCSDDETLEIIKNRLSLASIEYVIVPSDINLGIVKNYQTSFSYCRGEYIAIIEGDDYWTDPERLEKHVKFLDSHRECVLSFNRFARFDGRLSRFEVVDWSVPDDFEYITTSMMAQGNRIGNLSACVLRRSAVERLKPDLFEMEIADWMLGMALGGSGLIVYLKDVMSVYRIHSQGQWSAFSEQEQKCKIMELIDIYDTYLGYKFSAEFTAYKERLSSPDNYRHVPVRETNSVLLVLLRVVVTCLKVLVPMTLKNKIKKIIFQIK